MIRVRKLVLAIAAATSLSSGMAHALGLGEITLQSALNQPLNADIALLEVRDLDNTEIIPRLASAEDFSKAGIERDYFLTNLHFTSVIMPNGKSMIRVTSSKPVREPYLNFLVEVIWPSGRVLREYTLLLDPPMYSPETAAAAPRLPVAAPVSAPRASTKPVDGPFKVGSLPGSKSSVAPAASSSRPAAEKPPVLDGQYRTNRNDTLWEIAQRTKGGASLNQTMLAIQDLNPDAFVGGNINRLKSGQVLRLPDAEQINARSSSEAVAQVAEQNKAWREGRSLPSVTARQLDATKRDAAGAAPAEVETKDSLRLVAADAGKAATASEKGSQVESKAISDKLAVTEESLDTSRRQGDELKGRVTDLQAQLDKLQKLVQLKDSQLAQLQADLAAREQQAAVTATNTPAEIVTETVTATPAVVEVETSIAPVDAAAPAAEATQSADESQTAPDQPEAMASQPETSAPVDQAPVAVAPTDEVKAVEAVVPVQVQPAQIDTEVVAVEESEPAGFVDELLGNPMLLGVGGAGLLIVLLGLMAMSRRNALKETEAAEAEAFVGNDDTGYADETELSDETFAGLDEDAADTAEAANKSHAADALVEADTYIAYGKFNQAAELLQNAINDEPQRVDLQLKQLEVMAELGDREGFLRQAADLEDLGGVSPELEQIKARYPAMVAAGFAAGVGAVASASAVGDLDIDDLISDIPSTSIPEDQDDAFDLSLDELETGGADGLQTVAPVSGQDLGDFSLDIDFDAPVTKQNETVDFDLSLDELSVEPAALEPLSKGIADDDFADFNLDLDGDTAGVAVDSDAFAGTTETDFDFDAFPEEDNSFATQAELKADNDQFSTSDFDLSPTEELQPLEPIVSAAESKVDPLSDAFGDLDASLDEFTAENMMSPQATGDASNGADEDFDFLSGTDETATKLDLARAYIDMGDAEGARDILDEVIAEGSETQQQEARELIGKLA